MTTGTRRWFTRIGDLALTIAALLGAVCIVLVIAAAVFDVRVILFSTGSMSPTIPTGSAAIVRSIPASEVAVGDVVTVERPGQLPITHRVTSVSTAPDLAAEARVITMRGDANAADDPFPYTVDRVRLVVFAVPGIATAVAAMGSPWVIGSVTVAATALVVVMFWPRRRRTPAEDPPEQDPPEQDPPEQDPPAAAAAEDDATTPATPGPRAVGTATLMVLLLATGAAVTAEPAAAATTRETVIQSEVIRLVSVQHTALGGLEPGTTATWEVGVSADAATPGTITVRLASTGDPEPSLRYSIRACDRRWSASGCARAETIIDDDEIPLDGVERTLLSMADTEQRWLLIDVSMPPTAGEATGVVDLMVRAIGVGDDVSVGDGDVLPDTGGTVPWLLAAVGALLLVAGAVVMLRGRTRR